MATQATANKAAADAERYRIALLVLQAAGRKALDTSLPERDQHNWAKLYLAKTMPDLKAVEHSGDAANPVAIAAVQRVIHDPAHDTNT